MSVLRYGDYLKDHTLVIRYDVPFPGNVDVYEEYAGILTHLRKHGCTITPTACIPEPGVMLLYFTDGKIQENRFLSLYQINEKPSLQATRIQIISSLRAMYLAGIDFIRMDTDELRELIDIMIMTQENVAVSTDIRGIGIVTVLNTPYCMLGSYMFHDPVLRASSGTYSQIRLIPYLLLTLFRIPVTLGNYTFEPNPDWRRSHDVRGLNMIVEGTLPGVDESVYTAFAIEALEQAISSVRHVAPDVDVTNQIFASPESVILF